MYLSLPNVHPADWSGRSFARKEAIAWCKAAIDTTDDVPLPGYDMNGLQYVRLALSRLPISNCDITT